MDQKPHLFVIDPIERLNLKLDSSLRLAFALISLGQRVYICHRTDLFWNRQDGSASAAARQIHFGTTPAEVTLAAEACNVTLNQFATIQMRLEPPFDLSYITTTWLLDSAGSDTLVINHPHALRRYNEKLAILQFPRDCDKALVSCQPKQIFAFVENECHGDAIIKPLDMYGGRGVVRLQLKGAPKADLAKIEEICEGGQSVRLIQPFNPAIFAGEVRAFAVGGKPVAWCLKVPAKGSYMANTREGATLHPYTPTNDLSARITRISQQLWQEGVAFVGYDIIGDFISEINITSPRLLVPPGEDETAFYHDIAQWLLAQGAQLKSPAT